MKKSLILYWLLVPAFVQAQNVEGYPVVGKLIPDFSLPVQYYTAKTFSPRAVKNKWIILDFWNRRCASCIKSFPKVNALQQEFAEDIQFLLIGQIDAHDNSGVEKIYERYRAALDLTLPISYDSALFSRFKVESAPHIIIIDPEQKVYAITYGSQVTRKNLAALVADKKPFFEKKSYSFEQSTPVVPWSYAIDVLDSAERNFIFRSVLSANNGEPMTSWSIDQYSEQGFFQIMGASLFDLYNIAYVGQVNWGRAERNYAKHWKKPILEISDSSAFQVDRSSRKGLYNYSISVPKQKASVAYLMHQMQRDLEDYFGFEVNEEVRMMPYWKLTARPEAAVMLKSKRAKIPLQNNAGIRGTRLTMDNILGSIERYGATGGLPIFDETEITGRIDINFSAVMTDIDDIKRGLSTQGLVLEKSMREMKVLVIHDKPLSSPGRVDN